jgi:translation initiation factor 2B subunit (eIF-2B alpha/beta/delta family)/8-oxo-dGTP pyrophosphatase MutT (NUDIX family)
MIAPSIHRVVTCFILSSQQEQNEDVQVAIFHRCDTMPSFPSYWAGISGTIEANETPWQAAQRELEEETNLSSKLVHAAGLYVNVPVSPSRIVRVYPFVVNVPAKHGGLELKGTEHDEFKFVYIAQLEALQSQCVPGLLQAFHHATRGTFLLNKSSDNKSQTPSVPLSIPSSVQEWARDKENGASVMTQNACNLLEDIQDLETRIQLASTIAMLRPTMVPIVNAMHQIITNKGTFEPKLLFHELERSVDLGREAIQALYSQLLLEERGGGGTGQNIKLTIATFSRSGTLVKILQPLLMEDDNSSSNCFRVICGKSTPGDEGELMAQDLGVNAVCVSDEELLKALPTVDLLLIGSDCIIPNRLVVNKTGTKVLCEMARQHKVPVYCCSDRWKIWDDVFTPPLETDLFDEVSIDLIDRVLVPPPMDPSNEG